MKTIVRLCMGIVSLGATLGFFGCGGSGPAAPVDSSASGRVALSIHIASATNSGSRQTAGKQTARPGAGAGIPTGALALKVELTESGSVPFDQTQIIPTPADGSDATVQFSLVPTGPATVTVGAFGVIDATGSPLESGSAAVTISPNVVTPVTVTLAPVTAVVTLSPSSAAIAVGSPTNGASLFTASLATPSETPISGFPVIWSVDNSTIGSLSVSPTNPNEATVTGLSPGTVVLEAREPNTGVIGQATITVTAP